MCELDHEHGRPLAVATWAADGMYWAAGRHLTDGSNGFYKTRGEAAAFGPRHADDLRRNRWFKVELLNEAERAALALRE